MKKNVFLLLLGLLCAWQSFAQTTGVAFESIRWDKGTSAVYGRVRRDYATYPAPGSNTAFYAAISNGTLPVLDRVGPSWLSARITYLQSQKYLEVEASGASNVQLKFERSDGQALTGANPDGVNLSSGQFYYPGQISVGAYTKIWTFGKTGNGIGGIDLVPIKLTFKNVDTGETFVQNFTPINKASRAQLFVAGNSSPPVTPAPSWVAARYSYTASTNYLTIEASGEAMQLKFERVDGLPLTGGNVDGINSLVSGTYYGNGPLTGQGSYDKQWQFGKRSDGSGGIPTVPIRLTFKRNSDNSTYAFEFTPAAVTRQQLFGSGSTTPVTSCNFTISTANQNVGCGATMTLSANATGADANGLTFTWMGNGINLLGQSVTLTAPGGNGSYAYTVTASKNGCSNKTATASVTVSGCGQGGGNTTAANQPTWDTFNYTPITENMNVWPNYDSRTHVFDGQTRPIGRWIGLNNGQVDMRIWEGFGGGIGHLSGPDGYNRINQHDLGRGLQYAIYRDGALSPNNPSPDQISQQWASIGNDPIEVGNTFQQPSEVLQTGFNSTTVYVKTRTRNWAVRDEYTDCIIEKWVSLNGIAAEVHTKMTFNRTDDHQQYDARTNEYPCLYAPGEFRRVRYTDASGNMGAKEGQTSQIPFTIAKPWVALENVYNSSQSIGMWQPGMYKTTQTDFAMQEVGGEFANGSGYTVCYKQLIADWNSVHYNTYSIVIGSADQVKAYSDSRVDPENTFVHKFNSRNGRDGFKWQNGRDSGFPCPDTGVEITRIGNANQDVFRLYSPNFGIPASSVQNLFVRLKTTGSSTQKTFVWVKAGQSEGQAEGNGQYITFNTINDNQFHTYQIPVSQNGGWNGVINTYSLRGENSMQPGDKLTWAWMNTVDAEP